MPNNPFDRTSLGIRERPLSSDLNRAQGQLDRSLREMMRVLTSGRASNTSAAAQPRTGFVGAGLRVVASNPTAMTVVVSDGHGFIYDQSDVPTDLGAPDLEGVHDLSAFKPVFLISPVTFNVPAAPAPGNTRVDIIEVKTDRRLGDSEVRLQLDQTTRQFGPKAFFKTLQFGLDGRTGSVTDPANSTAGLSYKAGTAGAPGAVPATSPGYTKLAEVLVGSGTVTVTSQNIVDRRRIIMPNGGIARASIRFRNQWNGGAPIITVESINAPPGVELGVFPEAARAINTVVCTGGEITQATAGYMIASGLNNVGFHQQYRNGFNGVGSFLAGLAGGEQATLALMTPPVLIGQTQKRVALTTEVVRDLGGSLSSNDASLEDLRFNVWFDLAFH